MRSAGKPTINQPNAAGTTSQTLEAPLIVKDCCSDTEIYANVMNVSDVPFLKLSSHGALCSAVGVVENLKFPSLEHEIQKVIRSYSVRGLNEVLIEVHIQFKILQSGRRKIQRGQ